MYKQNERKQLLDIAQQSIETGLKQGHSISVNLAAYETPLQQQAASFVTLQKNAQLRGCIGTLEAHQPLAQDVAQNAFAAAFRDPRFPPLESAELGLLEIHISILSHAEAMHFSSEEDLLSQLKAGRDGLILQSGNHRGTFLPSVWEQLPDAHIFLNQLKIKAGLRPDEWPDDIQISRYFTEQFSRKITAT